MMEARKAAREAIRAACLSLAAAAARLRGLLLLPDADDAVEEKRSCRIRWTASARGLYSPTLGARALPSVAERRSLEIVVTAPPRLRGDRPSLRGEKRGWAAADDGGAAAAEERNSALTQENSVDDENDLRLLLQPLLRRPARDGRTTACLKDLATALARLMFVCFPRVWLCLLAVFAAACCCCCLLLLLVSSFLRMSGAACLLAASNGICERDVLFVT
mmetsp:Transcript_17086/g.39443  ORF Transcript_17086/g.39443 Transcript_17086/m.39443 type:complete len:219 (+) Transcript_17086:879-1535(+)